MEAAPHRGVVEARLLPRDHVAREDGIGKRTPFEDYRLISRGGTGVIAIDGKTLRRSYQKKGAKAPIHMVSAFAARQRLT